MDLMGVFGSGGGGNGFGKGGGKRRGNATHASKPSKPSKNPFQNNPFKPQEPVGVPRQPTYGNDQMTPTGAKPSGAKPTGAVPAGFTAQQWAQLQDAAKTNPQIAQLVQQYLSQQNGSGGTYLNPVKPGSTGGKPGGTGTPAADQSWRRTNPTTNTQLLRQLSYNAGEMGMPGGKVGAVIVPAYGSQGTVVNNPNMATYGQTPGAGEATFYHQSINGGMAPIAALAPLGVPANWNPGGGSGSGSGSGSGNNNGLHDQLQQYLNGLSQGGYSNRVGAGSGSVEQNLQREFSRQMNAGAGIGGMHLNMDSLWQAILGGKDIDKWMPNTAKQRAARNPNNGTPRPNDHGPAWNKPSPGTPGTPDDTMRPTIPSTGGTQPRGGTNPYGY